LQRNQYVTHTIPLFIPHYVVILPIPNAAIAAFYDAFDKGFSSRGRFPAGVTSTHRKIKK
jgi:hypothetical protein